MANKAKPKVNVKAAKAKQKQVKAAAMVAPKSTSLLERFLNLFR